MSWPGIQNRRENSHRAAEPQPKKEAKEAEEAKEARMAPSVRDHRAVGRGEETRNQTETRDWKPGTEPNFQLPRRAELCLEAASVLLLVVALQHGLYKCGSLVDSMARIPFLISWPGHPPEGRQEDALVNQVDIMPTLLDWSGLDVPKGVEGQRLPFRPGDTRRSFVYSEYGAGEAEYTWEDARKTPKRRAAGSSPNFKDTAVWQQLTRERSGHLRMIRTASHKFIRDSNGEIEFYDLAKDPYELDNAHGRPEYRSIERELDKKLT